MNAILEPAGLVDPDGPNRLVLTARLEPVGDLERFQPAGFPEIGHVLYDAPRDGDRIEKVCIVDSPASMANHLETVCLRSSFDPTPVRDLAELPYLRCVTDAGWPDDVRPGVYEVVRTSLIEGHRIASSYFLRGHRLQNGSPLSQFFEEDLRAECGVLPLGKQKAHPPVEAWWSTFRALFRYDPNSLVHGVLFPQWQLKVPRVLTAHHEAFGAGRVDYSGVKFDRLGLTTSGQPIFAADDETAFEIRATFILDLALLRSFGRDHLGLGLPEKEALLTLALWKVGRLLAFPFRYRSRCDLSCISLALKLDGKTSDLDPNELAGLPVAQHLRQAIDSFNQTEGAKDGGGRPVAGVTDIYWPPKNLYKKGYEPDAGGEAEDTDVGEEAEE